MLPLNLKIISGIYTRVKKYLKWIRKVAANGKCGNKLRKRSKRMKKKLPRVTPVAYSEKQKNKLKTSNWKNVELPAS